MLTSDLEKVRAPYKLLPTRTAPGSSVLMEESPRTRLALAAIYPSSPVIRKLPVLDAPHKCIADRVMLDPLTESPMTYKHWKLLYLAQFTIFPLLVFLIAVISMKWLGTVLPRFVAGGLWFLMFVVVTVRLIFLKCP